MRKNRRILIAGEDDFEKWTVTTISKGYDNSPLTLSETLRYVYAYLSIGKGLLIKRVISVLHRFLTASLKPSHVSFPNDSDINPEGEQDKHT